MTWMMSLRIESARSPSSTKVSLCSKSYKLPFSWTDRANLTEAHKSSLHLAAASEEFQRQSTALNLLQSVTRVIAGPKVVGRSNYLHAQVFLDIKR